MLLLRRQIRALDLRPLSAFLLRSGERAREGRYIKIVGDPRPFAFRSRVWSVVKSDETGISSSGFVSSNRSFFSKSDYFAAKMSLLRSENSTRALWVLRMGEEARRQRASKYRHATATRSSFEDALRKLAGGQFIKRGESGNVIRQWLARRNRLPWCP